MLNQLLLQDLLIRIIELGKYDIDTIVIVDKLNKTSLRNV